MRRSNGNGSDGDAGKGSKKLINLALQGGGAHGAFTWGVLDRILEDGRLEIEGISGTSAGAMNAVALVDGYVRNGAEGAREKLRFFWKSVSEWSKYSPVQRAPLDVLLGKWTLDDSPGYLLLQLLNQFASPYQLNPLKINPLRDLLEETIDFGRVSACKHPKLFISATNVETGRVKVFRGERVNLDAVMASACLPTMFQAVEINGVPYWDGGYMGNPVLFPFHESTETKDYVLVQINPVFRPGTPRTAHEIMNRVNEISFNASLLQELRAIDFVRRLIDSGKLSPKEYKRVNVHMIGHKELVPLGASSKFNAEWGFLEHLFEIGRRSAEAWLARDFHLLGEADGANLREVYQGDGSEPAHGLAEGR